MKNINPWFPLLKSQLFITTEHAAQCNGDNTSTLQKHKENQKYPDKVSVNFPVGEDSSVLTSNYQNYPLNSRHNCGEHARDVARLRELIPENWRVSRLALCLLRFFAVLLFSGLFRVISFHSVNANECHEISIIDPFPANNVPVLLVTLDKSVKTATFPECY